MKFLENINSKWKFWVLFIGVSSFYLFNSPDFGITCDENVLNHHGRILLEYFEGENDRARLSPFDENGNLFGVQSDGDAESIRGMNSTGGFFDLLCNFTYKYFGWFDEYENKHFINAAFGVFALLMICLTSKLFGGWNAAIFALICTSLAPRFMGHSMNNPKDIPFLAFYIFTIYHLIRFLQEIPVFKWKRVLFIAIGLGLGTNIRIGGLLLFPYAILFISIYWLYALKIEKTYHLKNDKWLIFRSFYFLGLALGLGYLSICLFWPLVQTDPLNLPVNFLTQLSNFAAFDSYGLYMGNWIHNYEIPWHYLPVWYGITFPLTILLGFVSLPFLFFGKRFFDNKKSKMYGSLVLFTFLFPIVYVIYKNSNIYDDGRHLYFALSGLFVLTGVFWSKILELLKGKKLMQYFAVGIFAVLIMEPVLWMARNHPHQSMYFSPIIGGINGAWKKYEIDYWGSSFKQGVEWIVENDVEATAENPRKIRVYYGSRTSAEYYIKDNPKFEFVFATDYSMDWDYHLAPPVIAKHDSKVLENWPPEGTVHQIEADGVPMVAIVKNDKSNILSRALNAYKLNKNPVLSLDLSLLYYMQNNMDSSLYYALQTTAMDPGNAFAFNNVCSCLNSLGRNTEAISFCQKALELVPDMELARNNLNIAMKGLPERKVLVEDEAAFQQYMQLGLSAYNSRNFKLALEHFEKCNTIKPRDAFTYNNLGSTLNNLERFKEAADACRKALAIDPTFELARNNLNVALEKLK